MLFAASARSAAAETGGLPLHESFESMLATATPTPLHAEQSIRALRAGALLFCEKPVCDNARDALRVKRAVEETGLVFNVGFMWRFSPAFRFLKDLIAQGRPAAQQPQHRRDPDPAHARRHPPPRRG